MNRRAFLKAAGVAAASLGVAVVAGCDGVPQYVKKAAPQNDVVVNWDSRTSALLDQVHWPVLQNGDTMTVTWHFTFMPVDHV